MINIKEFNQKQSKVPSLARIIEKDATRKVVAYKEWDLNQAKLGKLVELPEQVVVQTIKELEDRKIELQNEIVEIDKFLAL